MSTSSTNILRLNVGFILSEDIGYSRDIEFNADQIRLADDLLVIRFQGQVRLTRTPLGLLADGQFDGFYATQCTRCLIDTVAPLEINVSELYSFPREPDSELFITEARMLDLAPLVHQEMSLTKDIQVLCRPDCKGLCPECGINLNEATCDCEKDAVDPRLSVLKQLLEIRPD